MSRRKQTGVCCLCGKLGQLSFEHIPPKSAFNKATVIQSNWEGVSSAPRKSKGKSMQGGFGAYTLCEQCNNNTGHWYGDEYVKWARNGNELMKFWRQRGIKQGDFELTDVFPLRFLKQVVAMTFSELSKNANQKDAFAKKYPKLAEFVLNKHQKDLGTEFRFWINLYPPVEGKETAIRHNILSAKLSVIYNENSVHLTGRPLILGAEIAHPPFWLAVTSENDSCPNAQEITHFKDYGYDDTVNITLNLCFMDSSLPYPGA